MKRNTIIVIAVFVALMVAVMPLYYYTRPPATTTEEASLQIRGEVADPTNKTLTQLKKLHADHSASYDFLQQPPQDNGVFDYTGVKLKTLLDQAQVSDQCHIGLCASLRRLRLNNPYPRCAKRKHNHRIPTKRHSPHNY